MCLADRLGIALGVSCRQHIVPGWAIAVLGSLLALASSNDALATNGTWTRTTSGGLWSAIADWSGGTVATGTDGIANFDTLNITADDTVHLDSARTIGGLLFGDTTPSNDWILDNDGNAAHILTLAVSSGSPSIQVNNDTATISAVLAGTQGLAKKGAGTLFLAPGNTFGGGLSIQQGTLRIVTINNVGTNGSLGHNTSVALEQMAKRARLNSLARPRRATCRSRWPRLERARSRLISRARISLCLGPSAAAAH